MDEILALLDENAAAAREAIATTDDAEFARSWTLRNTVLNHLVHHRGQLTVYLRLTGAPVPQTYGPTADEPQI